MRGPHEAGSDPVPHCGGSLTSPPSCTSSAHIGGQPTAGLGSPSQNRPAEGRPVPKGLWQKLWARRGPSVPRAGVCASQDCSPRGSPEAGPSGRACARPPARLPSRRAGSSAPRRPFAVRLLAGSRRQNPAAQPRGAGSASCSSAPPALHIWYVQQDRKRARGVRVQYCFLTSSLHPPPPPGCSQRAS